MIFFVFFFILLILFLLLPIFYRGAPFIATDRNKIKRILSLIQIKPGEKAVDLGSGDGRLLVALAGAGAESCGFEINPFLVWWSRYNIRRFNLTGKAIALRKNFWQEDMSPFTIVTIFGVGGNMMLKLEDKLRRELKPGARVVSNGFSFPNWPLAGRDRSLYFYKQI